MVADLDVERARAPGRRRRARRRRRPQVIANPKIDIVIELIGGYGIARTLVMEAIAAGKHVVTANKALLAVHGTEIFAAARDKGVMVAFEARSPAASRSSRRCAGPDRQPHRVDRRHHQRHDQLHPLGDARQGLDFDVVLEGGAAPRLRRGRPDLRHRGRGRGAQGDHHERDRVRHPGAVRQGARRGHHQAAQAADITYAEQLGYRIKLLGITRSAGALAAAPGGAAGIELRVHPTLVPAKRLIANVEGAMNAVVVHGDAVGNTLYYGRARAPSRRRRR